jgi:hypothetical protein
MPSIERWIVGVATHPHDNFKRNGKSMSLKRDEYWWIEDAKGDLRKRGRYMYSNAAPDLFMTKRQAQAFCLLGKRPVKVRLVKVEEE